MVQEKVNHAVAERRKWAKFGDEKGNKSGPDVKTTQVGENLTLKLGRVSLLKQQPQEEQQQSEGAESAVKPIKGKTVSCRICRGQHFTANCPYKDAGLVPMDELNTRAPEAAESGNTQGGADTASSAGTGAGSTGRYIAPHLRHGGGGSGENMRSGSNMRDRDDSATLRVTNVSEDATDDDLHALFSRFGSLARIYLAKDRDTGKAKGYAFVSYHDRDNAARALAKMDKFGFDNLIMRCEWAANRQ